MSNSEVHAISVILIYQNVEYRVRVSPHQYYSLMSMISDQLAIPDFGLCCGMGSCGTCLVKIAGCPRLACEVPLNDALSDAIITIEEGLC